MSHLPPQWDRRVLALLGSSGWDTGTFAPEAIRLLTAWTKAEGGMATWNPLNSTMTFMGSSPYNSSHVQNYRRPVDGVCATALTLLNGNYQGIAGFLQAPAITAEQAVMKYEPQFRVWGTNPQTILDVLRTTP